MVHNESTRRNEFLIEFALQRRFGMQMLLYMSHIRAGNEIAITVLYNTAGHVLSSQLRRKQLRSLESFESSVSRFLFARQIGRSRDIHVRLLLE